MPDKLVNLGGTIEGFPNIKPTGVDLSNGVPSQLSVNEQFENLKPLEISKGRESIPVQSFYTGNRYLSSLPGADNEEMAAQFQSGTDQLGNGLLKMLGTASTAFVSGTAGLLYGMGKSVNDGKFSSLYQNEVTENMDKLNVYLKDVLPNYYTHKEQDAEWYSSDNLLTANFWGDKVINNLGYSVGSIAGGAIWSKLLRSTGIINALVKEGKTLEMIEETEKAIQSVAKAQKYQALTSSLEGLSSKYLGNQVGKALTQSDRILTSVMGTFGEASLEALQNSNEFRNRLIQEYRNKYGENPTGEDLNEINTYSDKVGNFTWTFNTALLSATNYVQLPKILGSSRKAERIATNDITKNQAGEFVAKPLTKLEQAGNIASLLFAPIESFEEAAQFAAQSGVNDYFTRAYQNREDVSDLMKNLGGAVKGTLFEGFDKVFSTKEGMENLLIGGISGGLQTSFSPFGQNNIKERGFTGQGGERKKNTDLAVEALNSIKLKNVLKDNVDYVARAIESQKLRQEAIKNNDVAAEKNYENDYLLSLILPRVKYGKTDSLLEELKMYANQASSKAGFEQLKAEGIAKENETLDKFLDRIAEISNLAEKTNNLYDQIRDRYIGYNDDAVDRMVYSAAKVDYLGDRIPELASNLATKGIVVDAIVDDKLAGKEESYEKAKETLEKEGGLNKDILLEQLNDIVRLSQARKIFAQDYEDIKKNPDKYKDIPVPSKAKDGEPAKTVKIKDKSGEKEVVIGEEYYLGRVVEYDKSGKEVYRAPKLTIIGENEDGTIKIKDNKGNVRDVSKSVLEDYKLGKVKSTDSNKKAKFYMEHWNTIFEFNFGKGKKQRGRIEFDPESNKMFFIYKDKKGKIKEIEVTGDQFVPKKGYDNPMIKAIGELSVNQKASLEAMSAEKDTRTVDKRAARLDILNNLFDELTQSFDKVNKLIDQKKAELKNINEELAELEESIKNAEFDQRSKKALRFKSNTRKALDTAMRLSRMKEQLQQEIESLESEKEELEFNASYIADLASNIDELPTDSKDFLEEIKDQTDLLESALLETGKNINTLSKLIDNVDSALNSAIDYLNDLLSQFKTKYPKVPLALGQEWVDFLKANPNFLKKKPDYKEDLKQLEELIAQVEDLDIVPNERTLKELKSELQNLQKALSDTEKELKAKTLILDKFNDIAKQYQEQKVQEEKLKKDEQLREELLGSADPGLQSVPHTKEYEVASKKTDLQVVTSTKPTSVDLPHHKRANEFGQNKQVVSQINDGTIKGVLVTLKNEAELGLTGLMDLLKGNSDVDPYKTIAIVMVKDVNGKPVPVDVNGNILDNISVDSAIFQVMPDPELTWSKEYGGDSMFRDGKTRPEVVKHYTEQYKKWAAQVLESPSLKMHKIQASFGKPKYSGNLDSEGKFQPDYSARNSVEETGLLEADNLLTGPVIMIPTTDVNLEKGSTSFVSPLGRPFLSLPNAYVPLDNKQFTAKEAENLFNAILALSKQVFADGNARSDKSKRIFNWLKSVVYWGKPQNKAGYNTIYFKENKDGDLVLSISGKGKEIDFTPNSIQANKGEIITLIEGMYNNINNYLLSDKMWNQPYEELVFDKNGEVSEVKEWPNYQTYLLTAKGLPLSTRIRPVSETKPTNREGIYYTIKDTVDEWTAPAPKAKVTPVAAKKQNTKPTASKVTPGIEGSLDMTGKKHNTYISPEGRKIMFLAKSDALTNPASITVLQMGDFDAVVKKLTEELGAEKAKEKIKSVLKAAIAIKLKTQKSSEESDDDTYTIGEEEEEKASTKPAAKIELVDKDNVFGEEITEDDESKMASQEEEDDDTFTIARVKLQQQESDKVDLENWDKVEAWLKKNFPNIPVYRVKNVIKATNGLELWGMLKKGAIYVTKDAEVGTAYHEVFEAVWKMFSDTTEQKAIRSEFRQRKGSFIDRPTGKTVEYSEATNEEIKEQLAEEFRDYVLNGKIPAKPTQGKPWILKLFAELYNFLKTFFKGEAAQINTANLFEKIGTGYYAQYSPYSTQLSLAKEGVIDIDDAFADSESEYRVKGIPASTVHDILQHMTFVTLRDLILSNKSLFTISSPESKSQLYEKLKNDVQKRILLTKKSAEQDLASKKISQEVAKDKINRTIVLWKRLETEWSSIIKRHEEYLKIYDIEFDENDEIQVNNEDKIKESDYVDGNKIDYFKKLNSAIKLLLSTIPVVNNEGEPILSSVNGVTLVPLSKSYMAVMNKVHTSKNIDEMVDRIRIMAENDSNYKVLYNRLTKGNSDLSQIKDKHDLQLLAAFWRAFKKSSPEVKNLYIFDGENTEVGDSNFGSATRQLLSEYNNAIIKAVKSKKAYFEYDNTKRAFIGKPDGVKNVNLNSNLARVNFLKSLGIEFTEAEINLLLGRKKEQFDKATAGIKLSIEKKNNISTIGGKVLDIEGQLKALAEIRAIINNPEFDSTYFNVNGERTQTFIGTNPTSDLHDAISQAKTKDDLLNTNFAYLLKDVFSKNSVILKKIFAGNKRIEGTEDLLKPAYADGTVNLTKGKRKQSSKLTFKERLIQEINMNLKGYYYNLVPGDASMEWMVYTDNHITAKQLLSGNKDIHSVFKGYLESELELSKENRSITQNKKETRKSTDLRFFKEILGKDLHDKIIKDKRSFEEIYKANEKEINKALDKFFENEVNILRTSMLQFDIVKTSEEGDLYLEGINLPESDLTVQALDRHLLMLSANFAINNIELHKLLYSDPYQYSDELKRIKNANSPRQAIINSSPNFNKALNNVWNEGFKKGETGHTDFIRDFFRTITLNDIFSKSDLEKYGEFEETDGAGMISFKAYRNFRIRAGEWNDNEEKQYQYDVSLQNLVASGASKEEIKKFIKENNPRVRSALVNLKPIVFGNNFNPKSDNNNIVLDKFALYPLSFSVLYELDPESNAMRLLKKMQKEDIDYAVFGTGRKVGSDKKSDLYNTDGNFNDTKYEGIVNIPFNIMAIQTEVPSKDKAEVTRGSQMTKLVTLDFMENGVPIDYTKGISEWIKLTLDQKKEDSPIFKEIKNNEELLVAMIDAGYEKLLNDMGIKEVDGDFVIPDIRKTAETLRAEILKREMNDNIVDALSGFENGDVVIEATPAYQQIRNILYSIADREVISPKISGGMKVQIPSTLLESVRAKKEGKSYTSDVLKFYEDKDGQRVCEIMIGRWFKSDMSDEELLKYLNESPEGQKVLSGVAYRIPTQKQNSIDSFRIKQFLPYEFGDSVVIPSALVKKVGSDFDIDKLSIYLKNVFFDEKGRPKSLPFYGYGQKAKDKFKDLFLDLRELKIIEKEKKVQKTFNLQSLFGDIALGVKEEKVTNKWIPIFEKMFSSQLIDGKLPVQTIEEIFVNRLSKLDKDLDKLTDEDLQEALAEEMSEKWYRQSLENAYIESLENLVSHPLNFNRLVVPNSADQLKDLAKKVVEKSGQETFDYSSVKNMLSRNFMSNLRHAFVTGKYAIGIAAVNQTNHSLNQRANITIDSDRADKLSQEDLYWLTGGTMDAKDIDIKFADYNKSEVNGVLKPSLSGVKNTVGEYISDIIGQFIDGYVDISKGPWIMELGATPNVASTWLFLAKLGVPINDVAYFMNQPIIKDYLRMIENAGYSWLFIDDFVIGLSESPKYKVDSSQIGKVKKIPSADSLFKTIGKEELNDKEKAEQQVILKEFLKYSKMANQLFLITQGTNYDTAAFNDPFLVFKKHEQYKKAQNSIISSVDDILNNSFVGKLKQRIQDIRDAYAQILKSDHPNVREVVEKTLAPFTDMNDRDFIKISQKVVSDLFDYAVQVDRRLNTAIHDILISEGNTAKEVSDFVEKVKKNPKHPLYKNQVIEIITPHFSSKPDGVNNLKIKNKDNKIYDQNQLIYGFDELKQFLGDSPLYGKLIRLAVLQSGLSNSPISFTSMIPYEEFRTVYNDTLSKLEVFENLDKFNELHIFERKNWNNADVVPHRRARWKQNKEGKWKYNGNMQFFYNKGIQKAIDDKKIPQLVKLNNKSREADNEFILYSWEVGSKAEKKAKREKGDFSYIKKGLFQKVYQEGKPFELSFTTDSGIVITDYVYKMINAWGESGVYEGNYHSANEFYTTPTKSVIDNGMIKVDNEVADETILALFEVPEKKIFSETSAKSTNNTEIVSRYTIQDVKSNPNKIFVFGDNIQRIGTGGQAVIRNNANAFGIVTKLKPTNNADAFMSDKDLESNKKVIDSDINKIKSQNKPLVFPKDGFGTGLAKLKEKAPKTYEYLKQRLLQEFGFNNDTGTLDSKEDKSNSQIPDCA